MNLIADEVNKATSNTKIVLLGTGNPNPDPEHSGCSLAIIVNNTPYIIDFGPGLVRQAATLSTDFGGPLETMNVQNIKHAFLTHLHSDHTIGYPDLILTPWVIGRDKPLQVYGPKGLLEMTNYILKAYQADIDYRIYGLEPANDQGWRVDVHEHEFEEGKIFQDENIVVESFRVIHGSWPNAYGFRFTTADKTIVISGDCKPSENLIKYAHNADILIHEVYYQKGYDTKPDVWKTYHKDHHTSTYELGNIAEKTKPGVLILYHILYWGATDQDLLNEISQIYKGKVVVGKDLGIYED